MNLAKYLVAAALAVGCGGAGWWIGRQKPAPAGHWLMSKTTIPLATRVDGSYLIRMNPVNGTTEYLARVPMGKGDPKITWLPVSDREEVRREYLANGRETAMEEEREAAAALRLVAPSEAKYQRLSEEWEKTKKRLAEWEAAGKGR